MRLTSARDLHQLRKLLQLAKEIPVANLLLQSAQLPSANLVPTPKQSDLLLLRKDGPAVVVLLGNRQPSAVLLENLQPSAVLLVEPFESLAHLLKASVPVLQRKDGLHVAETVDAVALANLPSALPSAVLPSADPLVKVQ